MCTFLVYSKVPESLSAVLCVTFMFRHTVSPFKIPKYVFWSQTSSLVLRNGSAQVTKICFSFRNLKLWLILHQILVKLTKKENFLHFHYLALPYLLFLTILLLIRIEPIRLKMKIWSKQLLGAEVLNIPVHLLGQFHWFVDIFSKTTHLQYKLSSDFEIAKPYRMSLSFVPMFSISF